MSRRSKIAAAVLGLAASVAVLGLVVPDFYEAVAYHVTFAIEEIHPDPVEQAENLRYWEIYLTDEETLRSFDPSGRAGLASRTIEEASELMHGAFRKRTGMDPIDVLRMDPILLLQVGAEETPDEALLYRVMAASAELTQSVVHRRIAAVGARVARAAGRAGIRIEADPALGLDTAIVSRRGSGPVLYVGTELAVVAASDDELACILGHEIAHAIEGHAAHQAVPASLDASVGIDEREADAGAFASVAAAGFDAEACADLLTRLSSRSWACDTELGSCWWTTHPIDLERIARLRDLADDARARVGEQGE